MVLQGYHGTSLQAAESILRDEFEYSDATNWLGIGVYFWGDAKPYADGLACARWWVHTKHFSPWGILKSDIQSEKIFDCVHDDKCRQTFTQMKKKLLEKFGANTCTEQEYIDGIFAIIKRKFDVIVFFTKGDAMEHLDAADRLIVNLQVQICVSDTKCIMRTQLLDQGDTNDRA